MIIPKSWEKKPKREAKGKEDAYNKTKTMWFPLKDFISTIITLKIIEFLEIWRGFKQLVLHRSFPYKVDNYGEEKISNQMQKDLIRNDCLQLSPW